MPRSCSVRGRHNYGDTADDESHQSAHHAEMTGCLKALEGEEIVQEIAEPDAQGETDEKRFSKDVDANTVAMAADKDNHIWLVSLQTGEVWKMRINRFGWKTEQKSFNE